uniref:SFRICE_031897 n=1 Tax=Spodoptera frugiperda TaxID=7108 RepID=A0A2H1VPX2_SPOFR
MKNGYRWESTNGPFHQPHLNFKELLRQVTPNSYFKILDKYFLFCYGNKYFPRYIDLKYHMTLLLDSKA